MLDKLEVLKKTFDKKVWPELDLLLDKLSKHRFKDAESLIRFHECLLFMQAYPQNKKLLAKTKSLLKTIPARIKLLEKSGADLSAFEEFDKAGIAGTSITLITGYKFAQWLAATKDIKSDVDWEGYEEEERMAALLPKIIPFTEEETMVEPHIPFVEYIRNAKGKMSDLAYITKNISVLDESEKRKAELYEGLKLYIKVSPDFNSSRTGLTLETDATFFHEDALIQRRDISLKDELGRAGLDVQKLSASDGEGILALIRKASVVRFRELHGFIWGDPASFLKIELGRGVVFYMNEVFPENRLPLRAYHSGFMLKNGVPVGYVETLSMFERMEVGFNLYYTFRDGETAWLYAQLLRVFHQLLGVTLFSIDPYQIGHENEEGIESGAFWFYKKLGFLPVRKDVAAIVRKEEEKILKSKKYRTPDKTLRRIAESHMLYVYDTSSQRNSSKNELFDEWKNFYLKNVMSAVQEKVSGQFSGDAAGLREASVKELSSALGIDINKLKTFERNSFAEFAMLAYYQIGSWTEREKKSFAEILDAKINRSEADYLKLIQKHEAFREMVIDMGSKRH